MRQTDEVASDAAIARQQADSLVANAGIDGILQQVDVEPGQQVQTGAKLARIARPDELIARLRVSEALAKDLLMRLSVNVDTRNGMVKGRIERIDPAVRNGSVTIDVAAGGPHGSAVVGAGCRCTAHAGHGLPTCIRITVGTRSENTRLLAALDETLRQ